MGIGHKLAGIIYKYEKTAALEHRKASKGDSLACVCLLLAPAGGDEHLELLECELRRAQQLSGALGCGRRRRSFEWLEAV